MEMVSLKIGPPHQRLRVGDEWSHKDQREIVQIRISHYANPNQNLLVRIKSLQLVYLKDGRLSFSDIIGDKSFSGTSFHAIKLDYPAEYITGVEGDYNSNNLSALTVETNKNKYGPFGLRPRAATFSFNFGPENEFGGFHGTHDSSGVTSIGVYLTSPVFSPPRLCHKCLRHESEGDDDHDGNQVLKID